MTPAPSDLLTLGPAARLVEISTDWLRKLADRGDIPVTRTPSGLRLFRRADLEALRHRRAKAD